MESFQTRKNQEEEDEKLADKMLLEANKQKHQLMNQQNVRPDNPDLGEGSERRKIIEEEKQKVLFFCGLRANL